VAGSPPPPGGCCFLGLLPVLLTLNEEDIPRRDLDDLGRLSWRRSISPSLVVIAVTVLALDDGGVFNSDDDDDFS